MKYIILKRLSLTISLTVLGADWALATPLGNLRSPAALAQVSSVKRLDYKKLAWDAKKGRSPEILVDIPADAISFSVFATSDGMQDYYLVDSIIDPAGKVFTAVNLNPKDAPAGTKDGFGVGPLYSPNRSESPAWPGYSGVLVPNNPSLTLSAGKWRVGVRGTRGKGPSPVAPLVTILIKTKLGGGISKKTQGVVKVSLQFTGSDSLTAKKAATDSDFQNMLRNVQAVYAKIGLTLKIQNATDISYPQQVAQYGTEEMFNLYKQGTDADAVNVIFVQNINLGGGNTAVGLSGALFGPAGISGASSGAVMAATFVPNPLMRIAPKHIILAHEIGHYLGLPHTYDSPNLMFDPKTSLKDHFTDTPKDMNSNNLMTPGVDHEAPELSPQQRLILLLSPLVTLFE